MQNSVMGEGSVNPVGAMDGSEKRGKIDDIDGECYYIGCPTSDVAQRAMREAAPHARGVSKVRQL
jgi:hypothetical protein